LHCHAPFIYEFGDATSPAFDQRSYGRLPGTEETEVAFWCERYVCENADGIIYQGSDDSLRFLQEKYAIHAPIMKFQPEENHPRHKERQTPEDRLVRLSDEMDSRIDERLGFYEKAGLHARARKKMNLLVEVEERHRSKTRHADWRGIGAEAFFEGIGSFVLWPAGTMTRRLLTEGYFEEHGRTCRLMGVIDQRADDLLRIGDVPVFPSGRILKIKPDSIVITSDTFAEAILTEALQINRSFKIFRLSGQGRFFAWDSHRHRRADNELF